MLQKFTVPHHTFKFFHGHKVILLAVLLAAPGSTRGVGNGKDQVRNQFENLVGERGFARTRRCRDDIDEWLAVFAHSRFCTCSRDFSISAFISRPASVVVNAFPAVSSALII